jgi:hypothetical protein
MMTAALLALLLSQTPEPPRLAPARTPLPTQRFTQPAHCVDLAPTPQVPSGRYLVQCDEATRHCLAAPRRELGPEGRETEQPLARMSLCESSPLNSPWSIPPGYSVEPAIAAAPPGWYRDERGRVMQFNFDPHRRVWFGGGWAPLWRDGVRASSRGRLDFGVITETVSESARRLHRITLLQTELVLGQQSSLDATLLRYDTNFRPDRPFIRVSTFIGAPHRFDFGFDAGTFLELLRREQVRRNGVDSVFYTLVDGQLTLDLWHARDLASYVRVRAGPSVEYDRTHGFFTLVPGATLEADVTLDPDGFHHLTASAEAEKILLAPAVAGRPQRPERVRLRAGYELILLAINDQPVSLVLEGQGQWREDLAGTEPGTHPLWEWSAHTGLRVSLWAPPRRSATPLAAR